MSCAANKKLTVKSSHHHQRSSGAGALQQVEPDSAPAERVLEQQTREQVKPTPFAQSCKKLRLRNG